MITKITEKKRIITDAHEPNAGTDFHVLWCIERALSLLNYGNTGLKLIAIESLTPKDQVELDPDDDRLLAVDMSEYYDGEEIATASKLVISQLKYSTKHSQLEWTVARICEGKKVGGQGSIIDRFSSSFKALNGTNHLDKITIKLISNRPAHKDLSELVQYAKDLLNGITHNQIDIKNQKTNLARIGKVAKLSGTDLYKFVALLDFNDCSAYSRVLLRSQNLLKISEFGIQESKTQLAVLEAFVRSKTYPESKKYNTINRTDLLLEFGVHTYDSIFPVLNSFKEGKIIRRIQADKIYDAIEESDSTQPYCIHGPAGIGKTTFLQQIKDSNPENIFILFDCYGGGAYMDPEDLRHQHKYGLLTLCNEIATNIGTALLLNRGEQEGFYLKEFSKRIKDASLILETTKPGCNLYICIDAADNSIAAAKRLGEKEFISDLARLKYPGNVRLIITTRTFRKDFLEINDNVQYFELEPFSKDETIELLNLHKIPATESEVQDLYNLTKGVPRVINYTLTSKDGIISEKMQHLRPDGKDLNSIFRTIVEEAAIRSGDEYLFKTIVRHLIELPRPVPVSLVNKILDIEESYCNDLVIDLSSGLLKTGDHIHFNDEDFETFLDNWSKKTQVEYNKISEIFLSHADQNEYSSTHLGRYLELANKYENLQEIVLERKYLNTPEDHYKNVKVFLGRAKLAMKHAMSAKDSVVYAKLQVITAEAISSNQILENLLVSHSELGAIFTYDTTKDRRNSSIPSIEYLGSYYLRTSAILSRESRNIESAKALFSAAEAWISKWKSSKSPENNYVLEDIDLSYGIEACLLLYGFRRTVKWASQWNPKSAIFEILYSTAIRILSNTERSNVYKWEHDILLLRTDVKLELMRALKDVGIPIQVNIEKETTLLVRLQSKLKGNNLVLTASLCFAIEYLFENGSSEKLIENLAKKLHVNPPNRLPSFSAYSFEKLDEENVLRYAKYCTYLSNLEAIPINSEELLPKEKKNDDNKNHYAQNEDRQKLKQFYDILLPVLNFKLTALVHKPIDEEIFSNLSQLLSNIHYPYDFNGRFGNRDGITQLICEELLSILNLVKNRKRFFDIMQTELLGLMSSKSKLLMQLARRAVVLKESKITQDLLIAAEKEETLNVRPASEMITFYKEAAVIANSISFVTSKGYFEKLIKATEDIDLEAFDRIRLLSKIKPNDGRFSSIYSLKFAWYVEYCSIKLNGYDDFPWSSAIEGIALLDPYTVLPILCNWDHRSRLTLDESLLYGLNALLNFGILSKESISSLVICQNQYWQNYENVVDRLLGLYVAESDPRSTRLYLDYIYQDFIYEMDSNQQQRTLSDILKILRKYNFQDTRTVRSMEAYDKWNKKKHYVQEKSSALSKSSVFEESYTIPQLDLEDNKSFEHYLREFKSDDSRFFSQEEVTIIIENVKLLETNGIIFFLETLINLEEGLIPFYFYTEIIEESLKMQIDNTEVKLWIKNNFNNILISNGYEYLKIGEYDRAEQLNRLKLICGISDDKFQKIILETLPFILENLNGGELYRLLELTTLHMTNVQRSNFAEWLIELWSSKIKTESESPDYKLSIIPNNEENSIVGIYRYLLGHPDKRLRWRASRSLVRIIMFGNDNIIKNLLVSQNNPTCQPFSDKNEPFYWLASKTWLWVVIHKISNIQPKLLLNSIAEIKEEFNEPTLAHAQILWFVKATCLNLEKAFAGTFTEMEKSTLNSLFDSIKKKESKNRAIKFKNKKTRFKFNNLETVEHWYKKLGRSFSISSNDVALVVDEILIDEWLIPSVLPKVNNTAKYDSSLTYHRKYDRPTVEPYQTYLENQGMQCAAMRLLRKFPINNDEIDWNTWTYWLREQGLLWDNFWLSELKDPVPPEEQFWKKEIIGEDWKYEISFQKLLNLPGYGTLKNDTKFFILNEYSTINWGKNYESRTISSALVNTKYAQAALLTIQIKEGSYFHHFSSEDGNEDVEENFMYERAVKRSINIKNAGFHFIPTVKFLSPENSSIDEFDPAIKGMNKARCILSSAFSDNVNIKISSDKRIAKEDDEPISIFENWSNSPEFEKYGDDHTTGSRLYIAEDWLLAFLKKNDLALLLQSEMHRYQESKDDNYEHNEYSLYQLIHSDGTIQTISGSFSIGKTNSTII